MYRLLFILISTLFSITTMAQSTDTDAMLFGDVKDRATGEHLPNAMITVIRYQLAYSLRCFWTLPDC